MRCGGKGDAIPLIQFFKMPRPVGGVIHYKRGFAYHSLEQFKEAIPDYLKAIELNPKHPYSYSNLGACYEEEKDLDKSLKYLNKSIELNPKSSYSFFHRGNIHYEKDLLDLAMADYETAMKLNSKQSGPNTAIAAIHMKNGDYEKAKKYFLQEIEIKSSITRKLNLAEAYICLKEYNDAIKLAKEAAADSINSRDKIFAQYSLVTALILDGQDYKEDMTLLITMMKKYDDFNIDHWRFDDLLKFLKDPSIKSNNANMVNKIIALLKKEIKPDDFFKQ